MTQQDLAHRAGTTVTLVSAIETGRREPRLGSLQRIAAALDLTIGQLVDETPA